MAQIFEVHHKNPQERLLLQAVKLLQQGGVLAVPTDSCYALVCQLDKKSSVDHLRGIRKMDEKHLLTLMCKDLSQLASYAKVDNRQFRLLKQATPGPYTFVLEASKEVPHRISPPQRKTIGMRVPGNPVMQALLNLYETPLLGTTLILQGDEDSLNDAEEIDARIGKLLTGIVAAGTTPLQPTTVLDLTSTEQGGNPTVLRKGLGSLQALGIER